MDPLVAVYDACVLVPNFLRDFLVRLAIHGRHHGILRAKWTGRIHREWIRAVRRQRPDIQRSALLRTRRLMDQHVRGCRVQGYQRWERRLTLPDADDRHVLAAALACVADVIVTFNVDDFPDAVLRPFGVVAGVPDAFVRGLVDSGVVVSAARDHRASLTRPPLSSAGDLAALRRNGLPSTGDLLSTEPMCAPAVGRPTSLAGDTGV
jgi:PIN domain